MSNKNEQEEPIQIPLPETEENEMFAVVEEVLTGSRMSVICEDGKSRLARVPGGKRRRLGRINKKDLLIISPWDIQDDKADIVLKYRKNQAKLLSRKNSLPDIINVF